MSRRSRTTDAVRRSVAGSEREVENGSLYRRRLPPLPPREDEAVPQGQQVRRAEVPVRVPAVPARAARPRPAQGDRVPAPAAREAEGAAGVRGPGEAVPAVLRRGGTQAGQDR